MSSSVLYKCLRLITPSSSKLKNNCRKNIAVPGNIGNGQDVTIQTMNETKTRICFYNSNLQTQKKAIIILPWYFQYKFLIISQFTVSFLCYQIPQVSQVFPTPIRDYPITVQPKPSWMALALRTLNCSSHKPVMLILKASS